MISFLTGLSLKTWLILLAIVVVIGGALAVGGYVLYLRHSVAQAEAVAEETKTENNRLEQKNEGLIILQNTETIATEIENDKQLANTQAVNSNNSAAALDDSRRRDSSEFSGNRAAVNSRYCRQFPADSSCR